MHGPTGCQVFGYAYVLEEMQRFEILSLYVLALQMCRISVFVKRCCKRGMPESMVT